MSFLRHPIEFSRNHPRTADAALAATFLAMSIAMGITSDPEPGQRAIGGLGWVLIVSSNLPLAWRREAPVASLWTAMTFTVPYWILDYPDVAVGPTALVLLYSVAAHVERPRSLRHGLAAAGASMLVLILGVLVPQEDMPWFSIPINALIFTTAWILGDNVQNRRAYLNELVAKADQAEHTRDLESRRAVNLERTRIARELHDVVAHSMSVMVVQAGAARRTIHSDPAVAAESIAAIEETGRASLHEMRQILDVLRSDGDDAALAPSPTLGDVERLATQFTDAGLATSFSVDGAIQNLPAGLELSAYRIVQESLTNSLKHAGPARATVHISFAPGELRVEVCDDGRGAAADSQHNHTGRGLVGMRERVDAFGGSIHVGPQTGGGFRVVAKFPIERSA